MRWAHQQVWVGLRVSVWSGEDSDRGVRSVGAWWRSNQVRERHQSLQLIRAGPPEQADEGNSDFGQRPIEA